MPFARDQYCGKLFHVNDKSNALNKLQLSKVLSEHMYDIWLSINWTQLEFRRNIKQNSKVACQENESEDTVCDEWSYFIHLEL